MISSSGIKRGLAATAVSALAVAGLPFLATSASADAYTDQMAATDALLYTQYSGFGSVQSDGSNTTVHLLAGGGSSVQQVQFQYSSDAGATWTNIATVSRTNGGFSHEWTPPTGIYNLPTVEVQAIPLNNVGTPLAGVDNAPVIVGSLSTAVNIANAAGSTVGVFIQPYTTETATAELGVITGKTSDVSAGVDVEVSNLTTGGPTGTNAATEDAAAGGLRNFQGAVDFTGYAWDNVVPLINQAVVGAQSGSDDAELVNLTKQAITTVTAVADPTTVQTGNFADGVVTVLDAAGTPVAGAQVFNDINNDGVHDGGETFAYTDANGEATFPLLAGSPAGTQHVFIVNTTDGDDYEPAIDFRRTITVTSYTATATTISAASADGAAFDFDEYTPEPGANGEGDIAVTVKDQFGDNLDGQALSGRWTITPFDETQPATTEIATITDGDTDGIYDVAFPVGGIEGTYKLDAWIERDGNPGQTAGDLSAAPLTVAAGEASVVWEDDATAQAPAGTTATFEGVIGLDGGDVPLPNRNVAFTWTAGGGGNAVVAAQAAQPAGTTRISDTAASGTSDGAGNFAVAISDPAATPQLDELDGSLTVTPANTPAFGTNSDGSDVLDVDFLTSTAPGDVGDIDIDVDSLFDYATPGRPVDLDIEVRNDDGIELTDYPVTVTVDHGFLSPNAENMNDLTPDPVPSSESDLFGEWKSNGPSQEFTTDDDGDTGTVVAIERDEAFDTDDSVTTTVTVEAGGVTETVEFDFVTYVNPVNPGEVTIERADASEQSVTVLPKAPVGEDVYYNVFATDQFGNLIPDQWVELTDTLTNAYMNGDDNNTGAWSQLADWDPELQLDSEVAGDQTVTGSWTADTRTWTDDDLITPGFQYTPGSWDRTPDGKTSTDVGETVNWYVIDYANSVFSLTHTGADTQPVGTTVTETYKAVDQNGEGLEDLYVSFFRSGPDDLQDGDGNWDGLTNENGETFYVFQGAKAGTATVTAVVYDDEPWNGGSLIPQGEETDQVSFVGPVVRTSIVARLLGHNNGAKADKLKVNAPAKAQGAVVKLYKIVNGHKKLVKSSRLNASGDRSFRVADKNGNKFTKYIAVVKRTAVTKGDTTNRKSVR